MPMPDAADCDALVALCRHGTLSAAAKKRGVAITTIARRIAALEAATGLKLVDKRASGAVPTEAGRALAAASDGLSAQLDRIAHLAASLRGGTRTRPIRVSATEFIISDVLAPSIMQLTAGRTTVPIELRSEADIVSLAARDADIAVRMVRPEGASLIIRKLPALTLSLYTTRRYLSANPQALADLSRAHLLSYDDSYGPLPETAWIEERRLTGAVQLRTGSTRALLTATRNGAGIALLPDAIAARDPALVQLDARLAIPPRTPWLTFHEDMQRDAAVRHIADWIEHCFQRLVAGPDRPGALRPLR